MTTQPVLPQPVDPTPIERAYIDDTPANLWPTNQDSNFGIHRKVFCDTLTDVANQLRLIFNEIFANTSTQYLDHWEEQVGLPVNPSGLSIQERQVRVTSRSRRGAFTRTMRKQIIEDFITPTFGIAPIFGSGGLNLSSGVPLHSGVTDLTGTYTIRENWPDRNLILNSNFETDVLGWSSDGTYSSLAISTGQAKYGRYSARGVVANANPYIYVNPGVIVTAGQQYTASVWIFSPRATTASLQIIWRNGGTAISSSTQNTAIPANVLTRVSVTGVAPANANIALPFYQLIGMTVGDIVYYDAAQFEFNTLTDWNDAQGPAFYYEINFSNTIDIDFTALNRELIRVTPAGIQFAIIQSSSVVTGPTGVAYGAGAYGAGQYGG